MTETTWKAKQRCLDNMNIDFRETVSGSVDWVHLA
jgi:hypothetical protein